MREHGPLVIEVKSGRQRDYLPQVTLYCLMAMREYGCTASSYAIIYTDSHWVDQGAIDISDAQQYQRHLWARLGAAIEQTPCDYCQWCIKLVDCPALVARAVTVASHRWPELAPFDPAALPTDPGAMAAAYELAGQMEDWATAVKKYVRSAMACGAEVPGYELRERRGDMTVLDIPMACELSGIPPDEFMRLCRVKVGALRDAWAERHAADVDARTGKTMSQHRLKGEAFEAALAGALGREASYQVVEKVRAKK
jgi:hypothetical protein